MDQAAVAVGVEADLGAGGSEDRARVEDEIEPDGGLAVAAPDDLVEALGSSTVVDRVQKLLDLRFAVAEQHPVAEPGGPRADAEGAAVGATVGDVEIEPLGVAEEIRPVHGA